MGMTISAKRYGVYGFRCKIIFDDHSFISVPHRFNTFKLAAEAGQKLVDSMTEEQLRSTYQVKTRNPPMIPPSGMSSFR